MVQESPKYNKFMSYDNFKEDSIIPSPLSVITHTEKLEDSSIVDLNVEKDIIDQIRNQIKEGDAELKKGNFSKLHITIDN